MWVAAVYGRVGQSMGCEPPPVGLAPARVVVVIVPQPPIAASHDAPCVAARWLACGPLLVLFLFVARGDAAWEVRLTPQLSLATEYSDNVTYASNNGDQRSDLSLAATPALGWSLDRIDLRLDGRSDLRVERFLDNGDLDGADWHHRLGATWRLNERWTLAASDDWRETRNLDDLIDAGAIVVQRELRTTNEATATLTGTLTERTSLNLSYTNYNSQSEDPTNTDYLVHMAAVNATLQATEQLGLQAGANFQDYDFNPIPGDPARRRFFTRNYAVFAGANYRLSERLDARLQVGARYTEQTTRGLALDATAFPVGFVEIEATSDGVNGTFSGSATYALDRGAITLSASQDLTATTGAEGTVERRSFGLNANDWFAPDWQWSAGVLYSTNQTDTGLATTERDTHSLSAVAGLRYRINDYLDADLRVRRFDSQDDARGSDVERQTVVLTVTGRWPTTP